MTEINIPGGIVPTDKLPIDILNFLFSKLKQGYSILNINNVKTQVVSGMIYHFNIKILDHSNNKVHNYEMSVWSQPWLNPAFKINKITPIN